jgi:regulator of protease activity HflC (stomatin/prohibitin superfamily)
MARRRLAESEDSGFDNGGRRRIRRLAWAIAVPLGLGLIVLLILWNTFFHYVPPGEMLVIIAKNGTPLESNQVLAKAGQKGVQAEVLGEGWHFVMPVANTTERHKNVVVAPGEVGIVTSLGGAPPRDGRELAEMDDERGIKPEVLPPGSYRLNPYGYQVEMVSATEIRPGYVGVLRRQLGKKNAGLFADGPHDKGILRDVLQPGLFYVNTKEYEVIHCEVGIDQTSYRDHRRPNEHAITFQAKDGYPISIECTIEWEIQPKDAPSLLAEFGTEQNEGRTVVNFHAIESNVIDQHALQISRDRGFNFGTQDFLEGSHREAFQADFTRELEKVCREKNVTVRSAFIRQIIIPTEFLTQKKIKQMAAETKLTNEAKELTAQSEAEVEREHSMVEQSRAKVKAETERLVAGINREKDNVISRTDAQIEEMKAKFGAQIALLDAERKTVLGGADAEALRLRETAKSSLYKMKMDVFGSDGQAYLRYALSQQLNPKMVLRLFHSGPGTLWTNMENKNMNLLLPTAGGAKPEEPRTPALEKP